MTILVIAASLLLSAMPGFEGKVDRAESTANIDSVSPSGCDIQSAGLTEVACNDNGTPIDLGDDRIVFQLNPTGANISTRYNVTSSVGGISPESAPYGISTVFLLDTGTIGGGNVRITIIDEDNPLCQFTITVVDPGSCEPCLVEGGMISTESETIFCVGEGVEDSVLVQNIGAEGDSMKYIVANQSGVIIQLAPSDSSVFTFEDLGPGISLIHFISYDSNATNLVVGANLMDLQGCFDLSNGITIIRLAPENCQTGVDDVAKKAIKVYPNPTRGELNIETGILQVQRLEVIDGTGRVVYSGTHAREYQTLNLDVEPGMYFLVFHTDNGRVLKPLVVK